MIVFGGHTGSHFVENEDGDGGEYGGMDGDRASILNDLWELDVGHVTTFDVDARTSIADPLDDEAVHDGATLFTSLTVTPLAVVVLPPLVVVPRLATSSRVFLASGVVGSWSSTSRRS